ncbi:MAG: hypothetical protein JO295_13210, partial [Verrucomicrobia bacterium]|nr:hypothetical protein [Verrucomicrobiota bacterium]
QGLGLGLPLAQRIILAHGGRIELDPGSRGTCVNIVLPLRPQTKPAGWAGFFQSNASTGARRLGVMGASHPARPASAFAGANGPQELNGPRASESGSLATMPWESEPNGSPPPGK